MKYTIEYSLCCHKGRVRAKNQDNFCCKDKYLSSESEGTGGLICDSTTSAERTTLAVFDGMGGEQFGEVAAYIGATTTRKLLEEAPGEGEEFLFELCRRINGKICEFGVRSGADNTGSTGCFINFARKKIYLCNIGDSKINRYSEGELTQLSVDHCLEYVAGKAPLTQYLGVPEREFIIQPYCTSVRYSVGDRYLICSDGLTDMVDKDTICEIMGASADAEKCCYALTELALKNGGKDNVTVLVCEVTRKSFF